MASLPDVHLAYGPMLIDTLSSQPAHAPEQTLHAGVFFNMILYGVFVGQGPMVLQALTYYQLYRRDGAWMRYFVRARSESDGAQDTETRTPQVFYLFVVETLNTGFDMAMMYQLLVLQYGQQLDYFPREPIFVVLPLSVSFSAPLSPHPHPIPSRDTHYVLRGETVQRWRGGGDYEQQGRGDGDGRASTGAGSVVRARWGWRRDGEGGERGHGRGGTTTGRERETMNGTGTEDDGGGYYGGGDGDGSFCSVVGPAHGPASCLFGISDFGFRCSRLATRRRSASAGPSRNGIDFGNRPSESII
ncbi:hypothetical protein B0H13DRAFT_1912413 [Mycena leptocephala]|nr:hypothetical protein B0H13DRAFT_1912413 [Mycena leptocephala]